MITTSVLALAGLLLFTGCDSQPGPDPTTNCYETPTEGFNGLNAMLVYKLAQNYKNSQLAAIAEAGNPDDARSVWFDLQTLKRFINQVETQTCGRCNGEPSQVLGIRIYYGTYPDITAWDDEDWTNALNGVPRENAGKHTVMMVPTYRKTYRQNNVDVAVDVDFDPNFIASGCNFTGIETFYDSMATNPPTGITLTVLSGMQTTAQNHGDMIPPPFTSPERLQKGAGIMYAVDEYPTD